MDQLGVLTVGTFAPKEGRHTLSSTPQALRQWLQATHPQAWAAGAPSPPRPSRHHHTRKGQDKGKGRARDTKEHSGKRAPRGPK